jgi:hypothetical protein
MLAIQTAMAICWLSSRPTGGSKTKLRRFFDAIEVARNKRRDAASPERERDDARLPANSRRCDSHLRCSSPVAGKHSVSVWRSPSGYRSLNGPVAKSHASTTPPAL